MRNGFLFLSLGALLLCAVEGCTPGERRATVSGKVTYKDKAVPGGVVIFLAEDKAKVERALIQEDGTYSSPNVPYGTMLVGVEPPRKVMQPPTGPKGAKFPKDKEAGTYTPPVISAPASDVDIPEKYQNPETSGLKVVIDSSSKTYDIPLK